MKFIFLVFFCIGCGIYASYIPPGFLYECSNPRIQTRILDEKEPEWLLEYFKGVKDAGYDLDEILVCGQTPLQVAVMGDFLNVVTALVQSGADPFLKNSGNESAIEMAINDSRVEIVEYFKSAGYIEDDESSSVEDDQEQEDNQEDHEEDQEEEETISSGSANVTSQTPNFVIDGEQQASVRIDDDGLDDGLDYDGIFSALNDIDPMIPDLPKSPSYQAPLYSHQVNLPKGQEYILGEQFYYL
jgi:hypothetical protein